MEEKKAARPKPTGKCTLCGGTFSKRAMARHVQACRKTHDLPAPKSGVRKTRKAQVFHLVVEGQHAPMYWMHLEVPTGATLADLDQFLRDIWLECCGHLSAFTIEGRQYVSQAAREMNARTMNFSLGKALGPGAEFFHEYDFGSTTYLKLKVVAEREAEVRGEKVQVLARNDPPEYLCDSCGKPAKHVCAECVWDGKGLLCDKCARKHKCGEEMLLPLVNSPRAGVCGYTGPEE